MDTCAWSRGLQMRKLYLELKNLRLLFYVPPAVLLILVPLTFQTRILPSAGILPNFWLAMFGSFLQLMITGFAAWWPILVLKDYVNSPGKELLFVHNSGGLLPRMMVLWALYGLGTLLVFVYLTSRFEFVWFLFSLIISQSLFMISLGYLLSLLLKNTFVSLIVNFVYVSAFLFSVMATPYSPPLNIFEVSMYDTTATLSRSIVVAVVAIAFLGWGYWIEKRLYRHSI